ncbi:hypothetical protein [Pseudoalteromonas sp. P1-9]|uniref:hypothetical protein n=1 Tax=Pseudoalteromonas sp. P1-9 TaxID=1710354 RepID=UPI0006D64790|nr:hypothetical protein [Pseudoalteromonas sp. P1-9]
MRKNIDLYLFIIVLLPFAFAGLLINKQDLPIRERYVVFESYEYVGRRHGFQFRAFEEKTLHTWYTTKIEAIQYLKPGQKVRIKSKECNEKGGCGRIISLHDGKNYLIKEQNND